MTRSPQRIVNLRSRQAHEPSSPIAQSSTNKGAVIAHWLSSHKTRCHPIYVYAKHTNHHRAKRPSSQTHEPSSRKTPITPIIAQRPSHISSHNAHHHLSSHNAHRTKRPSHTKPSNRHAQLPVAQESENQFESRRNSMRLFLEKSSSVCPREIG